MIEKASLGSLNVRPPSVDFTNTIPSPEFEPSAKANWRQKTYTSPFGVTAMSEPWALATAPEMMIGLEKVAPLSVERENMIRFWPAPVNSVQAT